MKFWNFSEQESGGRELYFKGTIAEESWFEDDITPKMFRDELNACTGDITVYINSPGGDVFAASEIYTMLMEYTGNVTVKIDSLAASAASVIAMAGTTIEMAPTAMLMIHNPSTFAFGDHNEMQKAIEMLDEVKESIISAYELKTGLSRNKISKLMENETWMSAKRAVELGFADSIIGESDNESAEDYMFSAKKSSDNLIGKIVAHVRKEAPKGVPVGGLYDRLENMKKLF